MMSCSFASVPLIAPVATPENCLHLEGTLLDTTFVEAVEESHESSASIVNACGTDVSAKVRLVPHNPNAHPLTAAWLRTRFAHECVAVHEEPSWAFESVCETLLGLPPGTSHLLLQTELTPGETAAIAGTYSGDVSIDWVTRPREDDCANELAVTGGAPYAATLALGAFGVMNGVALLAQRRRDQEDPYGY